MQCDGPDSGLKTRGCAARKVAITFTTIVVMLVIVAFPPAPKPLDSEADSTLSAVLNHAHETGLQFGSDIVSTYGPLGFLSFFFYSEHLVALRMVTDVVVAAAIAAGLVAVAWRLGVFWRWLLLCIVLWFGANAWPKTDWLINCGLLSWGTLCFVQSGRRLAVSVAVFVALAVFAALTKVSFAVVTAVGTMLVAGDLLTRGFWKLAFGAGFGLAIGFLGGWMLAGQSVSNLPIFLARSVEVVRSYNQALGLEGAPAVRLSGWLVAPALGAMILIRAWTAFDGRTWKLRIRRLWLFMWIGLFAFTTWKHGWVRVDGFHVVMFLGFVPVLVLTLAVVPINSRIARILSGIFALAICCVAILSLQMYFFSDWRHALVQPLRAFGENASVLLNPGEYRERQRAIMTENRREAALPRCREIVGRAATDVFGQDGGYALLNDLNYQPRPVFQSYAACNEALAALNERFYLDRPATEYVLFHLHALDRKIPVLEDPRVFRHLLINYSPVAAEKKFLLLKSKSSESPVMTLLREGTVEVGGRIGVAEFGDANLWLEIELKPNLAGRLRQFFYRPAVVRLAAWRAAGRGLIRRNRAPPSMLAAGFVASPLLPDDEDVLNFYSGGDLIRPAAYSVEVPPGEDSFWNGTVRYRIYRIENSMGGSVTAEFAARLKQSRLDDLHRGAASGKSSEEINADKAHPFRVFSSERWRPTRPLPDATQENIAYAGFLVLPLMSIAALLAFARKIKRREHRAGWSVLLLGNGLVLVVLISPLLLAGETYFRFFCDTTDSLGYTKVSEKWAERHWRVNAAGCRDNIEYSPERPRDHPRISFVGDSFTAGHGIENVEDRFPNILRRTHPDWQVHLLANVGLDTGSELAMLKKTLGKGYQLDQVVLVYCLNDIGDLMPEAGAVMEQLLAQADAASWPVQNSYLFNFFYHRYHALRQPYVRNYFSFVHDAYRGPLWERQKERLKEMRDLVESHGGHFSVVTFPFLHALGPDYAYRSVHEELDRFWRKLNVPHLDLLPTFKDKSPRDVTVNSHDAHPNERANRLAADAIGEWLVKLNGPP